MIFNFLLSHLSLHSAVLYVQGRTGSRILIMAGLHYRFIQTIDTGMGSEKSNPMIEKYLRYRLFCEGGYKL